MLQDSDHGARPDTRNYAELLDRLARLIPGVIYQYRLYPDGRSAFPWSSPGMSLIYEVTPEEVREDATPVFGRLHPEDYDQVAADIFESARTLEMFQAEFRVLLPKQGLKWRWSQAQPERMPDGGTLWHGIIIDVTERKLAEERAVELQSQLQQAMKMEAVGRLAGGVAHDFNNLLTAIIGNVAIALGKPDSVELVTESLTEIERAVRSAASLTRQLLAFSRKHVVEPRVMNPNDLVDSMQKLLRRLLGEDVRLEIQLADGLGAICIDPVQLEQVIVNLAVNSRDAMPEGGTLTVATTKVDLDAEFCARHEPLAPGEHVRLSVTDTGVGIDESQKPYLFEPFFTTKAEGQGTGLGLATTFGVVRQAGGAIDVDSEPGRGTTFALYFPCVASISPVLDFAADQPVRGGTETILLVEDQEVVRRVVTKVLTRLGYAVLAAEDGPSALALVEGSTRPIHLLLTDIIMPGISGRALAEQFLQRRPGVPVLFTSGYSENEISRHGVLIAGLNFIAKPYEPVALARKVRGLLDDSRQGLARSEAC